MTIEIKYPQAITEVYLDGEVLQIGKDYRLSLDGDWKVIVLETHKWIRCYH